jgi:uncharacterized protein
MSAVNSNVSDRDLEALRRAQRAHEPSMEEILASIRNIIAEEREQESPPAPRLAPSRPAAPAVAPQIVYSKAEPAFGPKAEPALEPQRTAAAQPADAAPEAPKVEADAAKAVRRQPEPAKSESSGGASQGDQEPLLSPEAGLAVTSSLDALAASLAARNAELADGMVREMLRPMLKAWLDENLPALVERLVRAEIERVARGPR